MRVLLPSTVDDVTGLTKRRASAARLDPDASMLSGSQKSARAELVLAKPRARADALVSPRSQLHTGDSAVVGTAKFSLVQAPQLYTRTTHAVTIMKRRIPFLKLCQDVRPSHASGIVPWEIEDLSLVTCTLQETCHDTNQASSKCVHHRATATPLYNTDRTIAQPNKSTHYRQKYLSASAE